MAATLNEQQQNTATATPAQPKVEQRSDEEIGKAFREGLQALASHASREDFEKIGELMDQVSDVHAELSKGGTATAGKVEARIGEHVRLGTGFASGELPASVKNLMQASVGEAGPSVRVAANDADAKHAANDTTRPVAESLNAADLDRVARARAMDREAAERQLRNAQESQDAAVEEALDKQLEEDVRRRKAREQEQAGQGLNTVDVQRSGKELERGDFIMPRRLTQAYTELDGKFYAKDSNRVMFEDKGEKLATSTNEKQAVADMVAYAKAKQWESLKLSGSQEFRREAWLQAESQGIKTQGYTPKQADLAALEALRQERSTNTITPLQERKAERKTPGTPAPRHDLNKNQAAMHAEATKNVTTNTEALRKKPGMAEKSVEDLTKLAYWRGIVAEQNKLQPESVQEEALARFDKEASDPQFLKRLNQQTEAKIEDKTTERVQRRETHEHSL